jgi:hypothetical protein
MLRYVIAGTILISSAGVLRADAFDHYFNAHLDKLTTAKEAQRITELTPNLMVEHSRALPGVTATFVVVRTNEGRLCKLLVQPAQQKLPKQTLPIALIERFVTFREGEERTLHASGQNVRLFDDFRFNLDIGQVVPAGVTADIRFIATGDKVFLEPIGKAEMFVVTKPLAEATPKKLPKLVVGAAFEPRYFSGSYKIYDDGRRSGILNLKVADDGEVAGFYYSDKDGQKYEVEGKVGRPNHSIQFKITFPRTVQQFQGWMFTGDGRAITGTSRLQERETGFYAVRQE